VFVRGDNLYLRVEFGSCISIRLCRLILTQSI